MKKRLLVIITGVLLLVTACSSNDSGPTPSHPTEGQAEGSVTFKLGHVSSQTNGYHVAMEHFAEKVKEKTNGTVAIQIFPNAQLGGDRDMIESISNGGQDMGFISLAVFSNFTPVFQGLQLPFLIENADIEFEMYKSDIVKKGMGELEAFDIKGLAIVQNGIHQFGTNKQPIRTPDDFKGQKIRSAESPMLLDSFRALGMEPVPMAYPETYNALQTGVIDGGSFQYATWYTDGLVDVIDNISATNHLVWPGMIVINLDKFNKLSDSQKKAMEEAAAETQDYMRAVEKEMNEKALQDLKDKGVNVIEDIDLAPFKERLQPVYDKYAEVHPLIKETIDKVESLKSSK